MYVPYRVRNLLHFSMISSPLAMSAEEEVCERDLSEIGYLLRPNNWKDFGRSLGLDGVQLQDLEFQYRKLQNAMTSPKANEANVCSCFW